VQAFPEPERQMPHRPLKPPKVARDEGLPPLPRRRLNREERWIWGGLLLGVGLVIGYFGYWSNWFGLTAPPTETGTVDGAGPVSTPHASPASLVILAVVVVVVLAALVWVVWGMRDTTPKFEDLPVEEQERRRQVAALLRQVEPPVSEEEARRQLQPPWLGPSDASVDRGESGS
jgi:hypothetical protein